jgi:hypothetical protein
MGREVKRVLKIFDWPLNKTWWGYTLDSIPCLYCSAQGVYNGNPCPVCNGDGWAYISVEVPAGDCYQLWETVTEGSPVTPPFETPEELARFCADPDNDVTTFGSTSFADYETWLNFIVKETPAPSFGLIDGKLISGVKIVANDINATIPDHSLDNLTDDEFEKYLEHLENYDDDDDLGARGVLDEF